MLHDVFSSWRSTCLLPLKTEVHAKRRDVGSWEGSWKLNEEKCATISTDLMSNRGLSNPDLEHCFKAMQNNRKNMCFLLPQQNSSTQSSLTYWQRNTLGFFFSVEKNGIVSAICKKPVCKNPKLPCLCAELGSALQCSAVQYGYSTPTENRGEFYLTILPPASRTAEDTPGIFLCYTLLWKCSMENEEGTACSSLPRYVWGDLPTQNGLQTSEHPGSSIFPKLSHLLL